MQLSEILRKLWAFPVIVVHGLRSVVRKTGGGIQHLWHLLTTALYRPKSLPNVEQATTATESAYDPLVEVFHDHAVRRLQQYRETHEEQVLQEGIQTARIAAQLTPALQDHPRRSEILETYHEFLEERFLLTRNRNDMLDLFMNLYNFLDFIPEDDPYALQIMHRMVGLLNSDPWQPVSFQSDVQDDHSESDSERPELYYFVSDLHWKRYEQFRVLRDLEESCRILKKAIGYNPSSKQQLLYWFRKLAFMQNKGYEHSHDMAYLGDIIVTCQQGLSVPMSDSNGEDRAVLLDAQANALQNRSKRMGNVEDLARSVSLTEDAVREATEPRSKTSYLNNLGNRLEDRFDRTGRLEDLRQAISITRSALEFGTVDERLLRGTSHNIGVKLLKLNRIDRREDQVEESFRRLNEAIGPTPASQDVPAVWLNSASEAYSVRYRRERNQEDLNTAIEYQSLALDRLPPEHPERPDYLHNMAWLLRKRAEQTREYADMVKGVRLAEEAVNLIPEGHVHEAGVTFTAARLFILAHTFDFGGIFELVIDGARWTPPWEDQARDLYLRCLNCHTGDPTVRMVAAAQLMGIFHKRGEFQRGAEVGLKALDILHQTNTRSLAREDQERIISKFSDIAVEACSMSLQAGNNPGRALEILEHGRGAILGLLIEDRSDISELTLAYPEHATRFERLRDDLRQPIRVGVEVASPQELASRRDRLVRDFDECLRTIRNLPGQERFLRGPTVNELQSCATDGPIVIIIAADHRSDAIIITQSTILTLNLPELNRQSVIEWIREDPTQWETRAERGSKNNAYLEFLKHLWSVCVEPVLRALDFLERPNSSELPRVWWIGAGVASFLPFHAAGDHTPGSTANTFSKIVSSYTPTIKALIYARACARRLKILEAKDPELLLVLMPTTPEVDGIEWPDLGVLSELSAITGAVSSTYSARSMEHPSCRDVLEQLPRYDMVHYACHAVSEAKHPSMSHLILQRPAGAPDSPPVADKLTVQDISHAVLGRARIAYLSACSTAENREVDLADEVIHLASGFQVAGFPHVIGTLWPSDDVVSVKVAEVFYQQLSAAHPADDKAIAVALHNAAVCIRDRFPRLPLNWAQYIHFGV